jgi:hypothetical protein
LLLKQGLTEEQPKAVNDARRAAMDAGKTPEEAENAASPVVKAFLARMSTEEDRVARGRALMLLVRDTPEGNPQATPGTTAPASPALKANKAPVTSGQSGKPPGADDHQRHREKTVQMKQALASSDADEKKLDRLAEAIRQESNADYRCDLLASPPLGHTWHEALR